MIELIQFDFRLNAYLFGCLVLLAFWSATLVVLRLTKRSDQIPEFWWASLTCAALGITEPLFVPEYWEPPSILKIGRWDLESFIFCFAVGGMSAVLTELPRVKAVLIELYFGVERLWRSVLRLVRTLTRDRIKPRLLDQAPSSRLILKDQTRIENMLLVTFFVGMFGATAHFDLNIIYDAAFVCVATAAMIAWRRPRLRWQILGGGITFTVIYGLVLVITGYFYPDFYDHWSPNLSGKTLLGAPIEEYVFSFTFGVVWAPLYEAWKETKS